MEQKLINTRIEDIMYRAGLTAQGCWDELDSYDRNAIMTFAQLIVKECTSICDNDYVRCGQDGAGWRLAREIEEHFGVKE